ncbi:lantibiotic dehydratase [Streptomyces sp. V3I7]|uniref:lantibiotic dehydratase n=1 Tax=Streptomyces sp. V3I7 TaxID=3042278 RepID=UPI0027D8A02C|nr:lantibiotic dehydratase [Streptomyces sp. V3I7]
MPSTMPVTASAATTPTEHARWNLVPRFMLRVAGLPFETAAALVSPASAAWADGVLDARLRLRARGAALADALQERVAHHLDDPAASRTLINLRRDVFNARAPRGLAAAEPLLPPAELAELRGWFAQRQQLDALLRTGSGILADDIASGRRELRGAATETDLRHGIQLSSPSLDEYLDGYLHRADGPLSKKERRIERSLLEYLLRTACKTSPFSTLTAVSAGEFTEAGGLPLTASVKGWDKRGSTRLNIAVLARLSELLTADPEVRRDLPVRATSGMQVHGDRVRYLRKLRGADGNADAAVTLDAVHESLFYLPSGVALADVLTLFGDDGTTTLRFGDAVRRLRALDDRRPEPEVERYLAQLLRLGLLVVPDLHLDIHDPDPVATYRRGLRRLGADWADDLAALVDRMGADVARFAGAGLPRRRELLSRIKESVADTHRRLGRDDIPVLRTLVYEDTTLPGLKATGDADTWDRHITPGLEQLTRILPAFDGNAVRRLVTKGFFRARYGTGGRCDDFLSFAHQFNQDFYDNYNQRLMRHQRFDGTEFRTYDNWFRQDEIAGIDRARRTVAQEMRLRYESAAERGGDLELDEDFLTAVERELPRAEDLRSLSFFLQVAENGTEDPLVVVNRIYSGLTLLFSRFAHCLDDGLTASLRRSLADAVPEGAVFAELKGGYDATNLNLHPFVTPYEIVCPGETSFRPARERIPVEDLIVEHDPAGDRLRLRSRRLGVEVIPVYLGFLLPMALPELQQVLLNFSCTTMVQLDLWEGTGVQEAAGGALPRVRLGNVVLQRRSWRFTPDQLPPAVARQSDEEWFLAWREWQRAAGLPRHVFASLGGEHKPQYVDFDSYMCVRLLETAVRKSDAAVVLTEMLPGPDDLWLRDGPHRYVTELTVQLDGVNGTDTER